MYAIQTLNNISPNGLELLPRGKYEVASGITNPDAILVRSFNMHDMELPANLKAIARAGAGTNNIPVDRCNEQGIVVFNTPGANANAVKELVIAALLLSSRKIYQGINWVQTLKGKGDEISNVVEKGKSNFAGQEIKGKTLGVIGLGAIGAMVADAAISLGMEVLGYDPFLSVDAAWNISRKVTRDLSLDHILANSDYITLHVPLNNNTKGLINKEKFELMKKGVRIVNFARGGLVINKDLLEAIDKGIVASYATDFPEEELLGNDKIIAIPHLGASTYESEENCAVMAVKQLMDFLEKGNIKNSVNFPECELTQRGNTRITVVHKNIPNMIGQIAAILHEKHLNIADMLNRSKNEIGYTIIDIEGELPKELFDKILAISGVKIVRLLQNNIQ